MDNNVILVIGAHSEIAQAIIHRHLEHDDVVYGVSRQLQQTSELPEKNLHWIVSDHSKGHIHEIIDNIQQQQQVISHVYCCTGLLHSEHIQPEKKIEDLDVEKTQQVFLVNTITPLMWLQGLKPLMRKHEQMVITVLSARVGSIEDNRSGGWYSYRASKSALNMMLKTASIEFSRINKNIKLVAFHPGTVDTPLSKPFQHSVQPDKLFTAEFVALQLEQCIKQLEFDGSLAYLDWAGESINF
jgi:NAD(P)-dependent dehydrogenase (short-subunit alcohol dehydrogenase family)